MQKVDVLLTCGCIKSVEIEAAVFVPKVDSEVECEKHGNQRILKASIPYFADFNKTVVDPNQGKLEE